MLNPNFTVYQLHSLVKLVLLHEDNVMCLKGLLRFPASLLYLFPSWSLPMSSGFYIHITHILVQSLVSSPWTFIIVPSCLKPLYSLYITLSKINFQHENLLCYFPAFNTLSAPYCLQKKVQTPQCELQGSTIHLGLIPPTSCQATAITPLCYDH